MNRVGIIKQIVAGYYGLTVEQLLTPTHKVEIARPRQIAIYFARRLTKLSLPDLATRFGGKHHTTVLWALGRIEKLRQDPDLEVNRDCADLEVMIRAALSDPPVPIDADAREVLRQQTIARGVAMFREYTRPNGGQNNIVALGRAAREVDLAVSVLREAIETADRDDEAAGHS